MMRGDVPELAEKSQALDVDTFLRMYYNEIVNTDSIGEVDMIKIWLIQAYILIDCLKVVKESSSEQRKSAMEYQSTISPPSCAPQPCTTRI